MDIQIEKIKTGMYRVTVRADRPSRHRVKVTADNLATLAGEGASYEDLIRESFAFLLERESNTMILSEFQISDIARYFPEYTKEISARVKKSRASEEQQEAPA